MHVLLSISTIRLQLPEDVLIILGHVEHLDGDELLEVSDGGQSGHSNKLSTQLWQLLWV